jgi:hypothetical protein
MAVIYKVVWTLNDWSKKEDDNEFPTEKLAREFAEEAMKIKKDVKSFKVIPLRIVVK